MVVKYESLWGKTVVLDVDPADAPAKEALVDGTAFYIDPCDHGWFRSQGVAALSQILAFETSHGSLYMASWNSCSLRIGI